MKSRQQFALLAFILAALFGPTENIAHEVKQKSVERRQLKLPINDFSLIDQAGHGFQFQKLRGRVVIVAFAYTTCPDVCPLITAALREIQMKLSVSERQNSHLLTVSTDPEIDSPKVLTAYAKRYGADLSDWSVLTGDESALRSVWKAFGVGVRRKARGLIDHTPLTAIVDRRGMLRVAYIGPSPDVNSVLADVRTLIAER